MSLHYFGGEDLEKKELKRLEAEAEKSIEKIFPKGLEEYDDKLDRVNAEKNVAETKIVEIQTKIDKVEQDNIEKYLLMGKKSWNENQIQEFEIERRYIEERRNEEAEFIENFRCVEDLTKEENEIICHGVVDNIKIINGKVVELSEVSKEEKTRLQKELTEFDERFNKEWIERRRQAIEKSLNGQDDTSLKQVTDAFQRAENAHRKKLAQKIESINRRVEEIDREYKSKHTLNGKVQNFISEYFKKENHIKTDAEVQNENENERNENNTESLISEKEIRELLNEDEAVENLERSNSGKFHTEEALESPLSEEQIRKLLDGENVVEDLEQLKSEDFNNEQALEIPLSEEKIRKLLDEEEDVVGNLEELCKEDFFEEESLARPLSKDEISRVIDGEDIINIKHNSEDRLIELNNEGKEVIEKEANTDHEKYEKYEENLEKFSYNIDTILNEFKDVSDEEKKLVKNRMLDTIFQQHDEAINRSIGDHGIRHITANIERSTEIYEKYCQAIGREQNYQEKLSLIIAQVHHDEGYLFRREMGNDGDHDKVSSSIFEEKHKNFYAETILKDEKGRAYLEKAQEVLGNHNEKIAYIERFDDDNLLNNCLSISDKLSVYADEKLPEYLVNNKEAMRDICHLSYLNVLASEGVINLEEKNENEAIFKNKLSQHIDVSDKERLLDEISCNSAQFVLGMNNGRIGEINFVKDENGEVILKVDIETVEEESETAELLKEQYFYKKNKQTGKMEPTSTLQERSVEKIMEDFGDYKNDNSGIKLNFKDISEDEINNEVLELTKKDANEWRNTKFLDGIREKTISDIQNMDKDLANIKDIDERVDLMHNRIAIVNHYLDYYIEENQGKITEQEKEAIYKISRNTLKIFITLGKEDLNENNVYELIDNFKLKSMRILNEDKINLLNKWGDDNFA